MAARRRDEQEEKEIARLAGEAEVSLAEDSSRRDLKEKRKIIKQVLYDGSNKLKHLIPKGKHL